MLPPPSGRVAVSVAPGVPSARAAARALARSLNLPYSESPDAATRLRLIRTDSRLELNDSETGARLWVEFGAAALRRYRAGGAGGDPLRRAIGPGARHVADATAGLGRDAVHLAALGYRVTAIERSAVASALVQDGLSRARAAGLLAGDNPRWLVGDARLLLSEIEPAPDTVYLDPMFPPKRRKSAAVRKEIQLLRMVAADGDPVELLAQARACATDRVVVKRPLDAPPLAPGAAAAYRGKLVRYDLYRARR